VRRCFLFLGLRCGYHGDIDKVVFCFCFISGSRPLLDDEGKEDDLVDRDAFDGDGKGEDRTDIEDDDDGVQPFED
jgi:hypothetical protein